MIPQPHVFQSAWYEWPIITTPLWLYGDRFASAGHASSIMAMGNPILWWVGIIALLYSAYAWLKPCLLRRQNADRRPAILVVGFLSQWLPWALVSRSTFIYHFLPAIPFLVLAIVLLFHKISLQNRRLSAAVSVCFLFAAILSFVCFFPYATGYTMPIEWAERMNWLYGGNWLYYMKN